MDSPRILIIADSALSAAAKELLAKLGTAVEIVTTKDAERMITADPHIKRLAAAKASLAPVLGVAHVTTSHDSGFYASKEHVTNCPNYRGRMRHHKNKI
jgi:hypothetical protein